MKAYWIAFVDVTKPEKYQKYLNQAPVALKAYGARILSRGTTFTALEGFSQHPTRAVVIEFDSYQQALDCYNSPEYQAAKQHRNDAAFAQVLIMQGLE